MISRVRGNEKSFQKPNARNAAFLARPAVSTNIGTTRFDCMPTSAANVDQNRMTFYSDWLSTDEQTRKTEFVFRATRKHTFLNKPFTGRPETLRYDLHLFVITRIINELVEQINGVADVPAE